MNKIIDPSSFPRESAMATALRTTARYYQVAYAKLMSFQWEWTSTVPFGATNGKTLYLNPKAIDHLSKMPNGSGLIAFLLVHEALHGLLGHSWRLMPLSDRKLANVAADYIINLLIDEQNKTIGREVFPIIEGALLDRTLPKEMSAEELYRKLQSEKRREQANQPPPPPAPPLPDEDDADDSEAGDDDGNLYPDSCDGDDDTDTDTTEGADADADADADTDSQSGGSGEADADDDAVDMSKFPGTGSEDTMDLPDDEDRETVIAETEADNERIFIADMIDHAQRSSSGSLGTRVADHRKAFSALDWVNQLREWLHKRSAQGWNSPMDVPSFITTKLISCGRRGKKCGDIVFVLDTSGSIGQDTYSRFLSAASDCLDELHPENMHLLSVSHVVCDSVSLQAGDPVPASLKGGGGTKFQPAFDWVRDHVDTPDVLVYLTDGYADDLRYLVSPDYPVLWLSTGLTAGDYPFGEVIELQDK